MLLLVEAVVMRSLWVSADTFVVLTVCDITIIDFFTIVDTTTVDIPV